MTRPASTPTRPEAEQPERLDPETERILRERLERDEPSEPWAVVKKRILESRRPAP